MASKKTEEEVKTSAISYAKAWGESPLPPTLLATLITAQHARPSPLLSFFPRYLPFLFPPALLFSTYLNIYDYKTDAAGTSAAWSALYLVLARRRRQPLAQKWGTRGIVRGATLGLCVANLASGGLVYALGEGRTTTTTATREGGGVV
ncbi:hypothetical protein MMC24_006725 [Lignoscripta atroalba]|nr:hypothetical protein [Lignoscripta atroalba]